MAAIKPVRTDEDLEQALARIDQIFDAEEGTPESDELDVLTVLVEHYEDEHEPIGFPTPVAAIEFRMEQAGLTNRDLIPFLGSRPQGVGSALRQAGHHHVDGTRAPPASRHTGRGAAPGARRQFRSSVRRTRA